MNKVKYLFQEKSVEELAKMMDRAVQDCETESMTLEEIVEDDAEGGYSFYEDEEE